MMLDPSPSVNKTYSLVIAEESHRLQGKSNVVGNPSSIPSGDMHDAMAFFSGKGKFSREGSGPTTTWSKKSSNCHLYCDFCNWNGHTSDHCYSLHGYPPDWKEKKRKVSSPITVNATSGKRHA